MHFYSLVGEVPVDILAECICVPSHSENLAPIRAGVVSILEKTNLGIGACWVLVNFLLADILLQCASVNQLELGYHLSLYNGERRSNWGRREIVLWDILGKWNISYPTSTKYVCPMSEGLSVNAKSLIRYTLLASGSRHETFTIWNVAQAMAI
jgi:hypothetical protein